MKLKSLYLPINGEDNGGGKHPLLNKTESDGQSKFVLLIPILERLVFLNKSWYM
jgi:hypothetical protein